MIVFVKRFSLGNLGVHFDIFLAIFTGFFGFWPFQNGPKMVVFDGIFHFSRNICIVASSGASHGNYIGKDVF